MSQGVRNQIFCSCCLIEYVLNLPNQLSPIECMNLQHDNKYNSDPMYVQIERTFHLNIHKFIGTGGSLPHTHIAPTETTIC